MSISRVKSDYGEELPLFRLIRQEGYRREPYLLAASLKALAKGDVRVIGGRVVGAGGSPIQGLCLDGEIEAALASG